VLILEANFNEIASFLITSHLNLDGKITLINLVLSSLPLFQCYALLAPKFILDQMASKIKLFLWEGGKIETKKFHLKKWPIIRSPKDKGGLFIKDIPIMNATLGTKIIWRLITRTMDCDGKEFFKKIFCRNEENMHG